MANVSVVLILIIAGIVVASDFEDENGKRQYDFESLNRYFNTNRIGYPLWTSVTEREEFEEMQLLAIEQFMNPRKDFCEDPFEFVCGKFDDFLIGLNFTTGYDYNVGELDKHMVNFLIEQQLALPRNEEDSEAERKAKDLYQSCLKIDNGVQTTQIREVLDWLGLWREARHNWIDMTAILLILDIPTIFQITSSQGSIRIIPAEMPDFWKEVSHARHDFMAFFYENLEAFDMLSYFSSQDMPVQLWKFENFLSDALHAASKCMAGQVKETRLHDVSRTVPGIDFRRLLTMFSGKNVVPQTKVEMGPSHCLESLEELFQKTENDLIADFFLWRTTVELLARLDISNDFDETRSQECVTYVKSNMLSAVVSLVGKKYYSYAANNSLQVMKENIEDVVDSALEILVAEGDDDIWSEAIESFTNVKYEIGFPEYILDRTSVDKEYSKCEISDGNFVFNQIYLAHCKYYHELNNFGIQYKYDPLDLEYDSVLDDNEKHIVIKLAKLMPMYSEIGLDFLNYARLGSDLAEQMIVKFLQQLKIVYNEAGKQYRGLTAATQDCPFLSEAELIKAVAFTSTRVPLGDSSENVVMNGSFYPQHRALSIAYLQRFCRTSRRFDEDVSDIIMSIIKYFFDCDDNGQTPDILHCRQTILSAFEL